MDTDDEQLGPTARPSSTSLICDTHFLGRHSIAISLFAEFKIFNVPAQSVLIRLLPFSEEDIGK